MSIVVTGLGAVSALGVGVDALWEGLLAGRSGLRRVPEAVAMGLPVTSGGPVPFTGPDRDVRLARAALDEAHQQAGLPPSAAAFFWANALDTFQVGPAGLVHRSAGQCFQELAHDYRNPRRMFAVACASGTRSVGEACHALRRGEADVAVAGGSAVMLTPFYLIGFAALRAVALDEDAPDPAHACRPFDATRAGFALADGAAALVLERRAHAEARGAPILAVVEGLGTSMDAYDLNRPPADGAGALACLRACLADAGRRPDEVGGVSAHGTGTRVGDVAEAAALQALFGPRGVPVHGVKGAIGHAMAAAGALEAVVAVQSCRAGRLPPTVGLTRPAEACDLDHVIGAPRRLGVARVLSASFGMGGQNAAILIAAAEETHA
ncbi:MAG: beta-ketoacyl-[acyl-carrier-protein] synthase family protein [Myxococcales bacterium]|nr:beta-ketoacyl-[acyl-carrier-protein] synthase family protein [Myxococcales bacterium]